MAMNSIKSLLGGASSALAAHKAAMDLIGKNIANANTPSYSRQRGILAPGGPGINVSLTSVQAVRSAAIQRSILGAEQSLGFQDGRMAPLELAEPALNDLDGGGVSYAIDDFFLSVSELAGNPNGTAERSNLLAKARAMAESINSAAAGIQDARAAAESEAKLVVSNVNKLTKQIASLNEQVTQAQANGQPSGEYVDQRDALLKQLAHEVDVQTVEHGDGNISVYLGTGVQLVGRKNASTLALEGGGPDALSLSVTKPTGTTVAVGAPPGGRLGGLFEARDDTLKSAADQLDQTAFGLATAVNDIHQAGFGTDGSTGLSFFDVPATSAGAAAALSVSDDVKGQPEKIAAALDPTKLPGDDANIQALLDVQDAKVVGGDKTVFEGWDQVVFTVSTALNDARTRMESEYVRASNLEQLRASESGVSLQEEMVNLTQAERAFQAASRVVETADELYESIMRMV